MSKYKITDFDEALALILDGPCVHIKADFMMLMLSAGSSNTADHYDNIPYASDMWIRDYFDCGGSPPNRGGISQVPDSPMDRAEEFKLAVIRMANWYLQFSPAVEVVSWTELPKGLTYTEIRCPSCPACVDRAETRNGENLQIVERQDFLGRPFYHCAVCETDFRVNTE